MHSPAAKSRPNSRLAGILYLLDAAAAGLPLLYLTSALIVPGNTAQAAALTAKNILAHEFGFRISMVAELIGAILFIFLVRVLYRLLHTVNRFHATLMVNLVLLSVPVTFFCVLTELAALTVLHVPAYLSAFTQPQLQAAAYLLLDLHGDGVNLANIFWGLWLCPFGLLVFNSRFLPRFLGVLLLLDSLALVAISLTALLAPQHLARVNQISLLPQLGELWVMLWFILKGVPADNAENSTPSTISSANSRPNQPS